MLFRSSLSGLPVTINEDDLTSFSFQLGETWYNHTFRVISLGAAQEKKLAEQQTVFLGILGMDFFAGKSLFIDFPNDLSGIDNAPIRSSDPLRKNATNLHMKLKDDRILLPVKIGSYTLNMLYDSGASPVNLITSHQVWKKITGKSGSESDNHVSELPGVSGGFTLISARAKHPS